MMVMLAGSEVAAGFVVSYLSSFTLEAEACRRRGSIISVGICGMWRHFCISSYAVSEYRNNAFKSHS